MFGSNRLEQPPNSQKGAETDISTLLSADILALLLQRKLVDRMLWNTCLPSGWTVRLITRRSQVQILSPQPRFDSDIIEMALLRRAFSCITTASHALPRVTTKNRLLSSRYKACF